MMLHLLNHVTARIIVIIVVAQSQLSIVMLCMEFGLLIGRIFVLLLNFAIDVLERVANQYGTVQRLFRDLSKP